MIGSAMSDRTGLSCRNARNASVGHCSPCLQLLSLQDPFLLLVWLFQHAIFPRLYLGTPTLSLRFVPSVIHKVFGLTPLSTLQHRDKPYNNPGVSPYITFIFSSCLTPSPRLRSSSHLRTLSAPMKSSPITHPSTRRQPPFHSSTLASAKTRHARASPL